MHKIKQVIILMALASLHYPCDSIAAADCRPPNMMIVGNGEQSFAEAHSPTLKLPIAEAVFLKQLKDLKLEFWRLGAGGSFPLEPPRLCDGFDMKTISHGYKIVGQTDKVKNRAELYLALVNGEGEVILIENQFDYQKSCGMESVLKLMPC